MFLWNITSESAKNVEGQARLVTMIDCVAQILIASCFYAILVITIRNSMTQTNGLRKTLTPFMLWGLGVGYVISGMYFGWNLGLERGGTAGMAIATAFIT